MKIGDISCRTCGNPIVTQHGHYRAKRRGYGYCSQSCEAAAKSIRADEATPMRLFERVDRGSHDGCWPYRGRLNKAGYGEIDWGGRPFGAHRLMFMIVNGDIPDGHEVCHSCDNPSCCNPDHLWAGTHAENVADMWSKGRARPQAQRGSKHGMSRLTEADIIAIRASNERRSVLAQRYSVGEQTISNIRSRRSWRHV